MPAEMLAIFCGETMSLLNWLEKAQYQLKQSDLGKNDINGITYVEIIADMMKTIEQCDHDWQQRANSHPRWHDEEAVAVDAYCARCGVKGEEIWMFSHYQDR